MLLSPALTFVYHIVVSAFGHLWMVYYAKRLPLPLFLLSVTLNVGLMVAEHVQPLLAGVGAFVPGGLWLQEHSVLLHVLNFVPTAFFCYLVYQRVDAVRATGGFVAVVLSDFISLTVLPNPPPPYDCVALAAAFVAPGGWVVYLW